MKKSFRKAAALALSLALVMLSGIFAFAASYTPVKGDAAHGFKQFLIIDKSARIPKIEYNKWRRHRRTHLSCSEHSQCTPRDKP